MHIAYALTALLPWVFLRSGVDAFLTPKTAVFHVLGWCLVFWTLYKHQPARGWWRNPWLPWLIGWIIAWSGWKFWWPFLTTKTSTGHVVFNWYIILPAIQIILGFLIVYVLVTYCFNTFYNVLRFTQVACCVATTVAFYALLQYLNMDQLFFTKDVTTQGILVSYDPPQRMIAALGNHTYTASYLALHIPLFFIFKEKRYLLMLSLILLAIFLIGKGYCTIISILMLTTYLGIRLYHRYPKWRVLLIGVILIGLISSPLILKKPIQSFTRDERWITWEIMYKDLRSNYRTLTGEGPGAFESQFFYQWKDVKNKYPEAIQTSKWRWAHNDPYQFIYEFGLVGFTFLVLLIFNCFRRAWKKTKSIVGASWFVSGIGCLLLSTIFPVWHIAPLAWVGLCIWAMNEAEWSEEGVT